MTIPKDINDYNVDAEKYSKIDLKGKGTLFLSFRDIPGLIQKYLQTDVPWKDCKCIDYGCGAGRSTRFLKSIGFPEVDGFDVSQTMLKDAKKFDPTGHYTLIQSAKIPANNNTYDLAFASFIFIEIGDKNAIEDIFREICRVLKPNGIFIIVTTNRNLYNPDSKWLSYKALSDKKNLQSGDVISLKMTDIDLELADYFWSDEDYEQWTEEAHMTLLAKDNPKGKDSDNIKWASEAKVSPYTLYVLRKP